MTLNNVTIKNLFSLYASAHTELSLEEVRQRINEMSDKIFSHIDNDDKYNGDALLIVVACLNMVASCINTVNETMQDRLCQAAFFATMLGERVIYQSINDDEMKEEIDVPKFVLEVVFAKRVEAEVQELNTEQ